MESSLMSLPDVQGKDRRISYHREVQKNDVSFRKRVRRIIVQELNFCEGELVNLLHSGSRAPSRDSTVSNRSVPASIARTMEELRELRAVLHQLSIDDDLADLHWKEHFSLSENKLSHNERKFIRCFSPTTMIAEVPRRTKSPVERARRHEERLSNASHHDDERTHPMRSSSFILRGDSNNRVAPPLFKRKLNHVPLSCVFRVAENGRKGAAARACFTPVSTTRAPLDQAYRASKKSVILPSQIAKENNNAALGMMQKNALRDAHESLASTINMLESHSGDDDPERDFLLAVTHCNIASCYRRSGKLTEAMHHLQTCADIERKSLGDAAPSTIINLGALYLQMGNVNDGSAVVIALLQSLNAKKHAGEHVSRHIIALCEEHLQTCDLYLQSLQREESELMSRSSPTESQNFDDCSPPFLDYTVYNSIIDRIRDRRRRRGLFNESRQNSTNASQMEWRSVSPVTFEEERFVPQKTNFTPPPASVRIGEDGERATEIASNEVCATNDSDPAVDDPVVETNEPIDSSIGMADVPVTDGVEIVDDPSASSKAENDTADGLAEIEAAR